MQKYLLKQISIVNENKIEKKDIYLKNGRIERIDNSIDVKEKVCEIIAEDKHLFPGVIDDQVHFRDPGLTHKGTIYTESKAAIAGGVTSFMEMPNTIPNALTIELLEEKYANASKNSVANYSFYMGVSNTNAEEVLKVNKMKSVVCGVKIFMGSSTGNMLVDSEPALHRIFSESELLIATHCEDEKIITQNYRQLKSIKPVLEIFDHPVIRDENACFASSSFAISLAKKYNSRLHVLHISTEKELSLFENHLPIREKRITAEVCVHHLHFTADDYEELGYLIKCNPAIKAAFNKDALWKALLDDRLDVIATDHAPHTLEEKLPPYEHAHAGLPLVQHPLLMMLSNFEKGKISLEKIAEKMSHAVADCFTIKDRGYIREGYVADLVMVNLKDKTTVSKENILYKCGWSPLEGETLPAKIEQVFVNGNLVYKNDYGKHWFDESVKGERLAFSNHR
ncbi:MAG: dihydroorotase [Ginsengibacter sp.]